MSEKDNIVPKDSWEFDEDVANCFSDMLSRSIPQYTVMRELSAQLVADVVNKRRDFTILDVGCSDGLMIQTMLKHFTGDVGRFVGVDVSEPMLNKAINRFEIINAASTNRVVIKNCDLRYSFPTNDYDAITSILSVQFIPIEYRQKILQNIYNNLVPGGVFIFVEKVLGNTSRLNELFVDNYYKMKSENGYSQEQIERKRLSLEGVLVPITSDWNISLLKQVGFTDIDVFWRWCNFVGYVAIK